MTEKKRDRGRPPKDGSGAMSSAERQKQYRERLRAARRRVPPPAQPLYDAQMLLRNILGSEDATEAGEALQLMRRQLMASLELVARIEQAMKTVKAEMHHFAIGGKSMDRGVRKDVFDEICAIDDAARTARKTFMEGPIRPPAWVYGEMDWK